MTIELPVKIEGLIPHQPPMLMVGELVCLEDGEAVSSTVFQANNPFVTNLGGLDEAAFFEITAQTFAAAFAVSNNNQTPPAGYLTGIKRLKITGRAFCGQPVEARVKTISTVDDFFVIEGRVSQNGKELASGQLTIFVPEGGEK